MDQVQFFKLLADETRLNIVSLVALNQELCVCDLQSKLALSQPKISRHLALLRQGGVLTARREGQWIYYSLNLHLENWSLEIINTIQQTVNGQKFANVDIGQCCE